MRKYMLILPLAVALSMLGGAVSAHASSYTFTFDTTTSGPSLKDGANAASIQTYMDAVLAADGCKGCSVTVTGAYADHTYNADGHVTGPGSSKAPTSLTLADSNGATASNSNSTFSTLPHGTTSDNFIATTNDSASSTSTEMTIAFHGFTVNGTVSFDYEIFPNITCTSITTSPNCGGKGNPNLPDFKFDVNGGTSVWTKYGVTPGTTNGNATHSPTSGTSAELAPQLIGTYSGTLSGVTSLDFIDWPATIGVDNLTISTSTISKTPVPEPGTLLLLGMGLSSLFLTRKKQQA